MATASPQGDSRFPPQPASQPIGPLDGPDSGGSSLTTPSSGAAASGSYLRLTPTFDASVPRTAEEIRRDYIASTLRGHVPASILSAGQLVQASATTGSPSNEIGAVEARSERIVIVMPSYNDPAKARVELATVAIESIRQQVTDGLNVPVTLVIADNGMSDIQRETLTHAAKTRGIEVHVADARPTSSDAKQRTAAYARNRAIEEISALAATDERFRASSIALLDDDGALGPAALAVVHDTMVRRRAVAVTAQAHKTPELTMEKLAAFRKQVLSDLRCTPEVAAQLIERAQQHEMELPNLYGTHGVDMNAIVAFSGDLSTKTAFVLLKQRLVERLSKHGGPFVPYPNGSFEDMLLGLSLNVHGAIVRQGAAHYLDQVCTDNRVLCKQKSRWGRDHVHAVNDFAANGNILPGLYVMEAIRGHDSKPTWVQWSIPANHLPRHDMVGFVLAPRELIAVGKELGRLAAEEPGALVEFFGPEFTAERIESGLKTFRKILAIVEAHRPNGALPVSPTRTLRTDLPDPASHHVAESLYSDTNAARFAQLAGNILGIHDALQREENSGSTEIPRGLLYGVRQGGSWESKSRP